MSVKSHQFPKSEFLFKLVVVGDVGTGKTSLVQRYVRDSVNQQYKPTIGVDFATKVVTYNETIIRAQIWDIAGHDRFANMMRVYYRDSHGAVVVCDCSKKDTVAGAFRWKKDLDYKLVLDNGQPIPAVLLANKCDLRNEFSTAELHELAIQSGFQAAFKISAKTGANVEEAFEFLIRQVLAAEKDGLYVAPISHRDHRIHRLAASEESLDGRHKGKLKDTFRNVCC
ncbi:Ras-related protein Rab [Aphelenchoides fujianensis]|nr:Ras-related protein Rab [Aphelenchoides fujianensis]